MVHILIICNYNRSVSKMAAAYLADKLKGQDFSVTDAGMSVRKGDRISPAAVAALQENGLFTEHTACTAISLKEIKQAELILCTTAELVRKLTDSYQSARGKTIHLMTYASERRDVFEPQKEVASHLQCLNMMKPGLDAIARKLLV